MNTLSFPSQWTRKQGMGVGAIVVALLMGSFFIFRTHATPVIEEAPTEKTTPWFEDNRIYFPASFARRENIDYSSVHKSTLTPNVYVTGEITWDARNLVAVGARISGRLRSPVKLEGERVKAGDILAEIESVELGRAQAEVLKARAREQVAKVDADRERKLADSRVSAERDAQVAQANFEALTAERIAAEKTVEALGGAAGGELGILKLKSPLEGTVVESRFRRGQTVSPEDTIVAVADTRRVWAEFTVFERDIPSIKVGDEVDVKLPSASGTVFKGTVAHVSEAVDPERRAGTVRIELANADGVLRPGLSVTAIIHASGPRAEMLTVKKTAVTRIDGKPTVFVKAGENAVVPRQVVLGAEDSDEVAVVSGLEEGEKVVSQGVLALKAEVYR